MWIYPPKSGITIDLTVLDVVLMGYHPDLSLLQPPTAQMKEHAKATLTMIGLPDREQENYNQLSEGQKQVMYALHGHSSVHVSFCSSMSRKAP